MQNRTQITRKNNDLHVEQSRCSSKQQARNNQTERAYAYVYV